MLSDPVIKTCPSMQMAGVRRIHNFAEADTGIPAQWQEFVTMGPLPGQQEETAYGIMCGTNMAAQTMEYMCAVEVTDFTALPETIGRLHLPPATYAVFTHDICISELGNSWSYIMTQWLPNSDYRDGATPPFERYCEDFDPTSGCGGIEIWLPVKPK